MKKIASIAIGVIVLAAVIAAAAFYEGSTTVMCFADNGTKTYTLMSTEQCMTARFACAEGEEYFSDQCGCGCKPIEGSNANASIPGGKLKAIECPDGYRGSEVCTREYIPVCGWFNASKVQCVTYPCAIDAGNICEACSNEDVAYYTEGMCPSGETRA